MSQPLRLFLSYRRADLSGLASALVGRIYDRLAAHYGKNSVFMDVDTIPPGVRFDDYISGSVAKANLVVVVIGPDWLTHLTARAGQADDFVRLEIESALDRNLPIVPLLLGGASMPSEAELPPSLRRLARFQAESIDTGRDFNTHVNRLLANLDHHHLRLPSGRPGRVWVGALAAVALCLGAGFWLWKAGLFPPPDAAGPVAQTSQKPIAAPALPEVPLTAPPPERTVPPPVPVFRGGADASFGTQGLVRLAIGAGHNEALACAILSDHSIIMAGLAEKSAGAGNFSGLLVKITPEGMRDESFGFGGRMLINFGPFNDGFEGVTTGPGDRIVAAGRAEVRGYGYDFGMIQILPNGHPDPGFGTDGKVITNFGNGNAESATSFAIVRTANDAVVSGGNVALGGEIHSALAKYRLDGSIDPAFGDNGKLLLNLQPGDESVIGLAALPRDRLAVVCTASVSEIPRIFVLCLRQDGTLDPAFHQAHNALLLPGMERNWARVIGSPDGRILVSSGSDGCAVVTSVLPDGTLDSSFADGGVFRGRQGSASAIGLDWDRAGRLVVGCAGLIVVRLSPTGQMDETLGVQGYLEPDSPFTGDVVRMVLDGQDRPVFAGRIRGSVTDDLFAFRYRLP